MAFNTFGLNKKKKKKKQKDKKQTGHTCPVFTVSLWGHSHHFLVAQDALRGGRGRRWAVKCHCFWLIFASLYNPVCCPWFFLCGLPTQQERHRGKKSMADILIYWRRSYLLGGCGVLKATGVRTYNIKKLKVLFPGAPLRKRLNRAHGFKESGGPAHMVGPKQGGPQLSFSKRLQNC